jgi:hypothetical protein
VRFLLPIIFQLFFFFGLAQTQGVVKTGGYLYPSPSVDVTNSIVYVSAGQPVKIFGRLTSHPNFIEVNINDKIGYMFFSTIDSASEIAWIEKDMEIEVESNQNQVFNFNVNDINEVRDYLDNYPLSHIEGVWETGGESQFKFLILESDENTFSGYILESNKWIMPGEFKFHLKKTANPTLFLVDPWIIYDSLDEVKGNARLSKGLLQVLLNGYSSIELFKTYPINSTTSLPNYIEPEVVPFTFMFP